MRYIAWLIGLPVAIVAITFAVINRQVVTIDLWPLPWTASLPLFLMVLGALGLGMVAGGVIVWVSGGRTRARARAEHRRANRLDHRVRALETENERLNQATRPPVTQRTLPSA